MGLLAVLSAVIALASDAISANVVGGLAMPASLNSTLLYQSTDKSERYGTPKYCFPTVASARWPGLRADLYGSWFT